MDEAIDKIIESPTLPENIKQRAGVIRYFMGVAERQRKPEDDASFGELFISEPNQKGERYFCLTFRDENGKEWTLLESLTPKTATYVLSMDTVREYGSLNLLVETFGKTEQRELGSKHIIHLYDWTVHSHVQRIYEKMASKQQP